MARPAGSRFDPILGLPEVRARNGAYNWGFVAGKSTQTIYPWDSWKEVRRRAPRLVPRHLSADGTPYDAKEVAYIRGVTDKR